MSRFKGFTDQERSIMRDGLLGEANLDPKEDPSFPPIIECAEALLTELEEAEE